ncbi:MAG: formate--tetrahydrofolate ligase, partial [Acetomicrobium sp.]
KVLEATKEEKSYKPLYELDLSLTEKMRTIATKVYGAEDVEYSSQALKTIKNLEEKGFGGLPVCMAKTQLSISDDPQKLGRPKGYKLTVREVRLSAGAGFVVAICGNIMTMPGLPKKPAAEFIDIDEEGNITGLF